MRRAQKILIHIKPIDQLEIAFDGPVPDPFGNLSHYTRINVSVSFSKDVIGHFFLTCAAIKNGTTISSQVSVLGATAGAMVHGDPIVGFFEPGQSVFVSATAWEPDHAPETASRPVVVPYSAMPELAAQLGASTTGSRISIDRVEPHNYAFTNTSCKIRIDVLYSDSPDEAKLYSKITVKGKPIELVQGPEAIPKRRQKGKEKTINAGLGDKVRISTWALVNQGSDTYEVDGGTIDWTVTDTDY